MFETFYDLSNTPFSRDIATDQLYSSIMLEETLGRLEYAAQRQLFAVITGDCGTGKTTIIRKFNLFRRKGRKDFQNNLYYYKYSGGYSESVLQETCL